MFYLTMHLTHFIIDILIGIGYMAKKHTDSEIRNPLPPLRELLFLNDSK